MKWFLFSFNLLATNCYSCEVAYSYIYSEMNTQLKMLCNSYFTFCTKKFSINPSPTPKKLNTKLRIIFFSHGVRHTNIKCICRYLLCSKLCEWWKLFILPPIVFLAKCPIRLLSSKMRLIESEAWLAKIASDRNPESWLAETNTICNDIILPY